MIILILNNIIWWNKYCMRWYRGKGYNIIWCDHVIMSCKMVQNGIIWDTILYHVIWYSLVKCNKIQYCIMLLIHIISCHIIYYVTCNIMWHVICYHIMMKAKKTVTCSKNINLTKHLDPTAQNQLLRLYMSHKMHHQWKYGKIRNSIYFDIVIKEHWFQKIFM